MTSIQEQIARAILRCTCNTGPGTDGPDQECAQHGEGAALYYLRSAADTARSFAPPAQPAVDLRPAIADAVQNYLDPDDCGNDPTCAYCRLIDQLAYMVRTFDEFTAPVEDHPTTAPPAQEAPSAVAVFDATEIFERTEVLDGEFIRDAVVVLEDDWDATRIDLASAAQEAPLRAAVESVLADVEHADTCGSMLSPFEVYPCSCWKADLRAVLDQISEVPCSTCEGSGRVDRAPGEPIGPDVDDDLRNPCPDCDQTSEVR